MSLLNKIEVNAHYTRSINIERDASNKAVVEAYIPTSRALRTLERVAAAFGESQTPRAWSLVGPYGSGKSSFAVFLTQLLAWQDDIATKAAFAVLKHADEGLSKTFSVHTKDSGGYCRIVLTGSPEPLAKRILHALHQAAKDNMHGKTRIVKTLEKAISTDTVSTTEIIEYVSALQDELAGKGVKGIIFTIDELGKFLEYEARHYGANDIFLLQALAEHACKGHSVNLLLFVLLHQSFEQYAKGLGENLKKEWSKVQGRFEEVPFLESAEQVLRIVASAFKHQLAATESKDIQLKVKEQIEALQEQNALPATMSQKEAVALFTRCYPLHPVSAILLPLFCQKIAQNERTLFSYLGSQEPSGLSDLLKKLTIGEFVQPHHIYDYFITNQPAVIGDHFTHRRWVEVLTALDRLGDANPETINLLKTIGLLNIIGAKGGLKASKDLLKLCFGKEFKKAESALVEKSIITYRKFNGEYRVWQGSDFDLEAALNEAQGKLGNFSLATTLAGRKPMLPIVARRYTIETGTLRYFQPQFADAQTYKGIPTTPTDPTVLFFLSAGQDDEKQFQEAVRNHFSDLYLTVLCRNGSQLREATAEVLALKQVQVHSQELNNDPIAKREFQDRLTAAEAAEEELLQNLLDYPADAKWYWKGKRQSVENKRQLQVVFSNVLSTVYHHTPIIKNELINRDKPSSQAIAARNKLLLAMLNQSDKEDLGIQKFPPEKAIYRSLFLATGLHKQVNAQWQFCKPDKNNRYNTHQVWERIDQFLDATEKEPKSFAELNQELMSPPYGVKAGVLPILYIAAYIISQHELALYESRIYRPYLTEEMLERFIKRPDEFTVQRFRIQGIRASLFKEYSKALHGDNGDVQRTLLDLARALAVEMGRLPEYSQKTEYGISKQAKDVRSAFNLSKSPERLLFQDLPKALGFESLESTSNEAQLAAFSESFTKALRELRNAYPELITHQRSLLAQAFNYHPNMSLKELRKAISGYCYGLESYTVDTQGLRAFIMRVTKSTSNDEEWLENILMFLGHKPTIKWLDTDAKISEHRLTTFSRGIIDLEKLRIHEKDRLLKSKIVGDFDVYLLRCIRKGYEQHDETALLDQPSREAIKELKQEIQQKIANTSLSKELQLALLAEIVDEFLTDFRKRQEDAAHSAPRAKSKALGEGI